MCVICTGKYDKNTTEVHCHGCQQVTSIPSTLVGLRELSVTNTKVTSIPSNLVNLQRLYCNCTKITSIPSTLVNLQALFCFNTKLTSIPDTLVNLEELACDNSSILFIPNLPNLIYLYCNNTPITSIPLGIQYSFSDNCPWLVLENISKLIPIQRRFKNKFKIRRVKELDKYFYPDIINLII
jgi:Leucine-rich repeat (LRR) protein